MNPGPEQNNRGMTDLPNWADCDLFCIHDYAAAGAPCGWRGRRQDACCDETQARLVCPRCGCATLLRIPSDRADEGDS